MEPLEIEDRRFLLSDGVFVVVRTSLGPNKGEIGIEATEVGFSKLRKIAEKKRLGVEELLRRNLLKALRHAVIKVPKHYIVRTLSEGIAPPGVKMALWLTPPDIPLPPSSGGTGSTQ